MACYNVFPSQELVKKRLEEKEERTKMNTGDVLPKSIQRTGHLVQGVAAGTLEAKLHYFL